MKCFVYLAQVLVGNVCVDLGGGYVAGLEGAQIHRIYNYIYLSILTNYI